MVAQTRQSSLSSRASALAGSTKRPDLQETDSQGNIRPVVDGLGWFSIGLGLAEIMAPNALARLIGMPPRPTLLRLYGLREIASGVGILRQRRPTEWVASRVAGDALDLATMGAFAASPKANRNRLLGAAMAVAGVTVLDALCTAMLSRKSARRRA